MPPKTPDHLQAGLGAERETVVATSATPAVRRPEGPVAESRLVQVLERHPFILEGTDFATDDEDIDEIEAALGAALPEELTALMRVTDGGQLVGPSGAIHLVSAEELLDYVERGVVSELEALPIARDEQGTVLVIDAGGEWGGPPGAVYRLRVGRREMRGVPIQDAVRAADSLTSLLDYLAEGRDAW